MLQIDTDRSPVLARHPAIREISPGNGAQRLGPLEAPFPQHLGVEVVEATKTRVHTRLIVRNEFCRSGQTMHGGAMMSFADITASVGAFLNLRPGYATTTIESKTNFLCAPKEGTVIEAESTPLHVGRRSSVWQTHIKREDGKLLAVVIQTQMAIELH